LSFNLALQATSLYNPALQATHFAGHNWRHVALPFSFNLARFGSYISASRLVSTCGSWLSCVKQQLALQTAPSCLAGKEITWRRWRCATLFFPFFYLPSFNLTINQPT
jgi:hypothetical protein